ncbi:hypothetical protein E8D34_09330 [Nocardioides sp. GY 10113]|nr:hypothetical protein E8D34_09330 [Nocardioides sp. GY 10113]
MLRCPTEWGTLQLTTYAAAKDLVAARGDVLDQRVGSLAAPGRAATYYSLDPAVAGGSARATIYWDDRAARQSAHLVGDRGAALATLRRAAASAQPSVTAPTVPADRGLTELAGIFSLTDCRRVPVRIAGESEESECRWNGTTARVGRFEAAGGLLSLRAEAAAAADDQDEGLADFWFHDTNGEEGRQRGEPEQGKIFGYTDATGQPALYLDDTSCPCWIKLSDAGAEDPRALYDRVF